MYKWRDLALKAERLIREVTIALVGKYTRLEDAYSSVIKALQHSALACNHKLKIKVRFFRTCQSLDEMYK